MKFNWHQTGLPRTFINRVGTGEKESEFQSVLNEAKRFLKNPEDPAMMARVLAQRGERSYMEIVRELTNSLNELKNATRRYEQLVSSLRAKGIDVNAVDDDCRSMTPEPEAHQDAEDEWEEWDRRFKALLQD